MSDEMTAEIREQLAEYAHDAWSGWMRYMLGILDAGEGPFGDAESYLNRWRRQMGQEYGELPEDERESDRCEADRMLAIVQPCIDTLAARLAAVEGAAKRTVLSADIGERYGLNESVRVIRRDVLDELRVSIGFPPVAATPQPEEKR